MNDHRPTFVRIAALLLIGAGALSAASAQEAVRQATAPDVSKTPAIQKLPAPAARVALTPPRPPQDCSPTRVLGTSRELQVGSEASAGIGLKTYPQTLALQDHEVVLTFDDGPLPATTGRVLDALSRECVKATFFLIGRNAAANPELVKREIREGHTVGSHSWSHPAVTLRSLSDSAARNEITRGMNAVDMAGWGETGPDGKPHIPFFRFPGFADTAPLLQFLKDRGVAVFGTDIWVEDWKPMTPQAQLQLLLRRLERAGRGVILLHDVHAQTAAMLPEFLRALKERGYKVVHIVPAAGAFPTNRISAGWTSETEPIVERVLGKYRPRAKAGQPLVRRSTCSGGVDCNGRVPAQGSATSGKI